LHPCQKPPWGHLTAIDLDRGEFRWRVVLGVMDDLVKRGIPPTGTSNLGGSMVTAGGLVFIGATNDSRFRAFDKDTGKELWETKLPFSGNATPITYEVDGQQYIAVLAGWGGAYPLLEGKDSNKSGNVRNISRVLAFRLGATSTLPAVPPESDLTLNTSPTEPASASVTNGEALFGRFCSVCHGEAVVGGGVVPDRGQVGDQLADTGFLGVGELPGVFVAGLVVVGLGLVERAQGGVVVRFEGVGDQPVGGVDGQVAAACQVSLVLSTLNMGGAQRVGFGRSLFELGGDL